MKYKLLTALLAVSCTLASTQHASAWSKLKFNIHVNLSWEGANNSLLWGLFKSGPGGSSGGYESDGYAPNGGDYAAMNPGYSPNAVAYAQQGYGYGQYSQMPNYGQGSPNTIQQTYYATQGAGQPVAYPMAYPQPQYSSPYSYGYYNPNRN